MIQKTYQYSLMLLCMFIFAQSNTKCMNKYNSTTYTQILANNTNGPLDDLFVNYLNNEASKPIPSKKRSNFTHTDDNQTPNKKQRTSQIEKLMSLPKNESTTTIKQCITCNLNMTEEQARFHNCTSPNTASRPWKQDLMPKTKTHKSEKLQIENDGFHHCEYWPDTLSPNQKNRPFMFNLNHATSLYNGTTSQSSKNTIVRWYKNNKQLYYDFSQSENQTL
jgi:hypothetical protein